MTAADRWDALVAARLGEIERLRPEHGPVGPSFWDARADRFAARGGDVEADDPLVAPLRRVLRPTDTVLDVGAGTGRCALAAAPLVTSVVALDPSSVMLSRLEAGARERALSNVTCVHGDWLTTEVGPADVVVCAYVLPVVTGVGAFVAKLARTARRRGFVFVSGASADAVHAPLWQHFHGRPRATAPTWLDARDVLAEQGLAVDTEIVELPVRARFTDLDEAVAAFREDLALPSDGGTEHELASLLATWLVPDPGDGRLRPPIATLPAAVLSWTAA